jgi:hypothetical protein
MFSNTFRKKVPAREPPLGKIVNYRDRIPPNESQSTFDKFNIKILHNPTQWGLNPPNESAVKLGRRILKNKCIEMLILSI